MLRRTMSLKQWKVRYALMTPTSQLPLLLHPRSQLPLSQRRTLSSQESRDRLIKDLGNTLSPYVHRIRSDLSIVKANLINQSGTLTALLNKLTGYDQVERRKNRAKLNYEETIDDRRRTQRELNSLLQRKDSWLDTDITRFTELYRRDLALEQSETTAQTAYKIASEQFEKAQVEYLGEIRERYVEEQLFSDKIRQASTWWTWGLISTHFLIFIAVQFYVEPRKKEILKRDMTAIILETSKHDRLAFASEVKDILATQQTRMELLHQESRDAMLNSTASIGFGIPSHNSIHENASRPDKLSIGNTPFDLEIGSINKSYLPLWSVSFWKGACAGVTVSFLSFVLLFGGR
ncbi:hypothetical protein BSLG_004674 [Batrachochytrium salamandrivorans]|nr:hypothetical protein BSLG_004674 [Batrachochytrium salamandrivorans]